MNNDNIRFFLKNLMGKNSNRKLVAFSVDDYGAQRTASRRARENLIKAGLPIEKNRFDMYDSLETAEDLEMLFKVLTSVKDKNGKNAVFTSFSLSANPNFEAMIKDGFHSYIYESLSDSYEKIQGNKKTLQLIKEGIGLGIFVPQYHGREHINLKIMMTLLQNKDKYAILNFENKSYSAIKSPFEYVSPTAAFDFVDISEIPVLGKIMEDGLILFEKIYGYKATHFASPGNRESHLLHKYLYKGNIEYLDSDFIRKEYREKGKFRLKSIDYTGKKNQLEQKYIVRNVVFEPMAGFIHDAIGTALSQIDIAFKMRKSVNISTHRVNFSGTIDPKYREEGLKALTILLKKIVNNYPDIEFVTTIQLN